MANRRMISKDVCASSKFLSLSYGARALLPLLVVEADDEGVVFAEKLRRSGNFRKKHMQELVQEQYIIPLDDKCDAAWIRDWDEMNKIPPSRFKESKYHEQVQELRMTHVKGMPDSVKTEPEKPAEIMALSNSHVDI